MTLITFSGLSGTPVEIHEVSRVWFEDGRTWYCKEGVDCRLSYSYKLIEIREDTE
jgi:hypothetical protein